MPEIKNPTELRVAIVFAVLYGVVLLVAAWLHDKAGAAGVYGVALVSGLTDVDPITLSSLRLFGIGNLAATQVTTAIGLAYIDYARREIGVGAFVGLLLFA